MEYKEILSEARNCIGEYCKACVVCDGNACKNSIPGPGAKGVGDLAIRNYKKWQEIRVCMDTLCENSPIDTSLELFGKTFKYPFFAGPVGAVTIHYGNKYDDLQYNKIIVSACADCGIAAFTGDGTNPLVMENATDVIKNYNGIGIPTVKPWNMDVIKEKLSLVDKSGAFAFAMDVDAAGLPFLKNMEPPAGCKNVEELTEIAKCLDIPFIVKGIMTAKSALKAVSSGAKGIVVSNHGGRVLDQGQASAEVLGEIVDAVKGKVKIFVDGGIRTGADVFKALAIGADAVLICRPFVPMIYGAGQQGVKVLVNKIASELTDTMLMCGARKLSEINRDMIRG